MSAAPPRFFRPAQEPEMESPVCDAEEAPCLYATPRPPVVQRAKGTRQAPCKLCAVRSQAAGRADGPGRARPASLRGSMIMAGSASPGTFAIEEPRADRARPRDDAQIRRRAGQADLRAGRARGRGRPTRARPESRAPASRALGHDGRGCPVRRRSRLHRPVGTLRRVSRRSSTGPPRHARSGPLRTRAILSARQRGTPR